MAQLPEIDVSTIGAKYEYLVEDNPFTVFPLCLSSIVTGGNHLWNGGLYQSVEARFRL